MGVGSKIEVFWGVWSKMGGGFNEKMMVFMEKWGGFRGFLGKKLGKSRKEPGI